MHIGVVCWLTQDYGQRVCVGAGRSVARHANVHLDLVSLESCAKPAASGLSCLAGFVTTVPPWDVKDIGLPRDIPSVSARFYEDRDGAVTVAVDYAKVGALGAEHLLSLNLGHLAVFALAPSRALDQLVLGFSDRVRSRGKESLPFFRSLDPGEMDAWLAHQPRPLGVLCATDAAAEYLLRSAQVQGLSVPRDVAVLGVGNEPLRCVPNGVSSIDLPAENIGYRAVERLLAMIRGEKVKSMRLPPLGVVTRSSTNVLLARDRVIEQAILHIRAEFRRDINTGSVARHLGIPVRTLQRRLRDEVGTSVQEEVLRCRLEYAARELASDDMPVKNVALGAGFRGVEHFSRFFKQRFGVSPSTYRVMSRRQG